MDEYNNIFIDGFGISNYKSFGEEIQKIGPLGKINIFIGQNNCGKSNILLFLKHHYATAFKCEALKLPPVDKHIGKRSEVQILEFGLRIGGYNFNSLLKQFQDRLENRKNARQLIEKIFRSKTLSQGGEVAWFRYEGTGKNAFSAKLVEEIYDEHILDNSEWREIWGVLSSRSGGGIKEHWIPETLRILSPVNLPIPKVDMIPAFREVKAGSAKDWNLSGAGLIEKLFELQNPRFEQIEDKDRFQEINKFVQKVVGSPNIELQIPHDKVYILVKMQGKTLPLTSLGTGIHEVILMAATGTILQNQVLCIEEPEIHLHPFLQKQLLRYLNEKTSNQYFISAHSAHILDTPNSMIFHVKLDQGKSLVEIVLSDTERSYVCDDLGYRASDLLQSNCIIWVEGPSDRIYINHWIYSKAPELIEGLHYSIMFYGGRLLSHLTANDPEVEDFISLRRLNRHITIIMDSDISVPEDEINETKKRIKEEFDKGPGFAWITKGREIENYIKPETLEDAVKEVHPCIKSLKNKSMYDDAFKEPILNEEYKNLAIDKVKVAKEVVKKEADFNILDLKEKMEQIFKFIREANGIKS